MTKYKSSGIFASAKNAIHGLKLAFFSQRNFVIEIIISCFILILCFLLKFSVTDICIAIIMISFVLICELINSAIEFTLDAVYKNHYSELVKMAKDISAGMVFLSCIISLITGSMLFLKYILKLFIIH